jgi:DNA primase
MVVGTSTKQFPQSWWNGLEWKKGDHPKGPLPYRLPELLKASPDATIYVTEGEKDCNTLVKLGLVATTAPGGAGKWKECLNKWFEGFRHFVVFEDNDPAGHADADIRARNLSRIPDAEVRVVSFREMPKHSDVTDWIEQGHALADLLARCEMAPPYRAELEILDAGEDDDILAAR